MSASQRLRLHGSIKMKWLCGNHTVYVINELAIGEASVGGDSKHNNSNACASQLRIYDSNVGSPAGISCCLLHICAHSTFMVSKSAKAKQQLTTQHQYCGPIWL